MSNKNKTAGNQQKPSIQHCPSTKHTNFFLPFPPAASPCSAYFCFCIYLFLLLIIIPITTPTTMTRTITIVTGIIGSFLAPSSSAFSPASSCAGADG